MRPARGSTTHLAFLLLAAMAGGCAYKGAVYSSYQEGGLGVRTTVESNAPIKVHFGYDRSVAAFVPRRGGDAASEEVTSIISKDDVRATVNPTRIGTDQLIAVDSAFITGTAAIVASAPANAVVTVADTSQALQAAAQGSCAPGTQTFRTTGDPGERVGVALTQQAALLSEAQVSLKVIHQVINSRPPEKQDEVFARAVGAMSTEFQSAYGARMAGGGLTAGDAFWLTESDYLTGQPDAGPRHAELYRALATANGEI